MTGMARALTAVIEIYQNITLLMSGDASDETIQNILNGTTADSELSSLSHLDAPNDSLYMVCGVLIAMVLVAVIIILLAVTISKLRKREEPSSVTTNHNNNVVRTSDPPAVVSCPPPPLPPPAEPRPPPPFLWRYSDAASNASSQYSLCNNDQTTLVHSLPCEEVSECKGFRKNLRGKWRRLVKKKPQQDVYTIPAELRDQLKQIYVY